MRYPTILFAIGLSWTNAVAHHSSVIFDEEQEIVIEGVVSDYAWRNPHVYIYVDTEDDSGQRMRWQIEADDIRTMLGSGWTPTTLVAGERVVVYANPDRIAERRHALMVSLSKPDGTTLTPEILEPSAPPVAAADIFSLWDPTRFIEAHLNSGSLTEKGAIAQAEYTDEDSPRSRCVPPAPPSTVVAGLIEISMQEEHILIQTEEFQIERIVYMDGRGHPTDGERTIQGHSIGRWESDGDGDVLVIDTTHFADLRDGNLFGTPSGAQKHLVERYELTDDGTQLRVSFVLEDPEYLQEPVTGGILLEHAANETFMPSACDPETARLWMYE